MRLAHLRQVGKIRKPEKINEKNQRPKLVMGELILEGFTKIPPTNVCPGHSKRDENYELKDRIEKSCIISGPTPVLLRTKKQIP